MGDTSKQLRDLIDSIGPKLQTLYLLCNRAQVKELERETGAVCGGEIMVGPSTYLRFYAMMEIFVNNIVPDMPGKLLKLDEASVNFLKSSGVYYPSLGRHVDWDTHHKICWGEIELESLKQGNLKN